MNKEESLQGIRIVIHSKKIAQKSLLKKDGTGSSDDKKHVGSTHWHPFTMIAESASGKQKTQCPSMQEGM